MKNLHSTAAKFALTKTVVTRFAKPKAAGRPLSTSIIETLSTSFSISR